MSKSPHADLNRKKLADKRPWSKVPEVDASLLCCSKMFMDSGAYTLFNTHVLGKKELVGKHGRGLQPKKLPRGAGNYSFYDLRPGTEFRRYCDKYAVFVRAMEGTGVICANVDVLHNPELTWKVQKYFEEEHGVRPTPVIHAGSDLKYLDRYVQGGYPLLGVGGLGHAMSIGDYIRWADKLYARVCPRSNDFLPLIRTHGFAMTSWKLMCRWPWWSVDSATWIKLASYGWILVPQWCNGRFRYDRAPLQVNMSRKVILAKDAEDEPITAANSTSQFDIDLPYANHARMNRFWWTAAGKHPREIRNKHYDNSVSAIKEQVDRWLDFLGMELDGKEGVTQSFRARAIVNLHYLKDLEESRPKWPFPLDRRIALGVESRQPLVTL